MIEGGVWWGLKNKVGKGAKVVLKGGSGLGDIVLIDSIKGRGPGNGGRRHW